MTNTFRVAGPAADRSAAALVAAGAAASRAVVAAAARWRCGGPHPWCGSR